MSDLGGRGAGSHKRRKLSAPSSHAPLQCKHFDTCREFLRNKLQISDHMLDPDYDVCFCSDCIDGLGDLDVYDRGIPPKKYAIPTGWVKFGVQVHSGFEKTHDVFKNWHIAFHGTRCTNMKEIVEGMQLLKPGDVRSDGTEIAIRTGHIEEGDVEGFNPNQIFFSPSPKYIDADVYAVAAKFKRVSSGSGADEFRVRAALQLRVQPDCYAVGPETVGADGVVDERFSNDELEWYTERRSTHVITGLLLKAEPVEKPAAAVRPREVSLLHSGEAFSVLLGKMTRAEDTVSTPILVVWKGQSESSSFKDIVTYLMGLLNTEGEDVLYGLVEAGRTDADYLRIDKNFGKLLGPVSVHGDGKANLLAVSPDSAQKVLGFRAWLFRAQRIPKFNMVVRAELGRVLAIEEDGREIARGKFGPATKLQPFFALHRHVA